MLNSCILQLAGFIQFFSSYSFHLEKTQKTLLNKESGAEHDNYQYH